MSSRVLRPRTTANKPPSEASAREPVVDEGIAFVDPPPSVDVPGDPAVVLDKAGKPQLVLGVGKLEWPRKLLHSSIGPLALYLYLIHFPLPLLRSALSIAAGTVFSVDLLRLRSTNLGRGRFARAYEHLLGPLMRAEERQRINGVVWYLLGVVVAISAFPRDIAVASILILSFADTSASTVGRLWGRYTPKLGRPFGERKSMAGMGAAVAVGAGIAWVVWGTSVAQRGALEGESVSWKGEEGGVGLAMLCAVVGVISGVVEALDIYNLDDNLTLPILSGLCIWAFLAIFQH